jgi:hypothetical protein
MQHQTQTTEQILVHGIIGGIVAAITLALAEMVMSLALGADFFAPIRLIASNPLGNAALAPTYALGTALFVGRALHLINACIYFFRFSEDASTV